MAMADVIWAIGDLHGDVHCARAWLRRTGALNLTSWQWLDERSRLIFLGDYIDKGPDSRAVLELVHRLTVEFPERVTALLGNHELNLLIDRTRQPGDRYLDYAYAAAHPAQYSSWLSGAIGGSPSEAEQRTLSALYAALQEVYAQGLQAKRTAACEGQVVRLERAAEGMDSWSVHVVHMEGEDAEPDQAKLELRR